MRPLADATLAVFRDSEQLRRIIDVYANVDPAILQGRAYEFLEVLKFNQAAAEQAQTFKQWRHTSVIPTAAADVLIRDGGGDQRSAGQELQPGR